MELFSAYVYASMAAYFEHRNLNGFANWMKVQVSEEVAHAQRFYQYILDVGGRVEFDAVDKPPADFDSPQAIFEEALKHERAVTKAIYKLIDLAMSESHHATATFLQWFVTEQVEEEKVAEDILARLKLVASSGEGLFLIDRELAGRKPDVPEATTA
jgi:ferritin